MGPAVSGIGGQGMAEQAADRGERQFRVGKVNVAVAALEADFLFDADAGAGEGVAAFRRIDEIQPVRKTNLFIQAGAFGRFDNANRVRARLTAIGPVKVSSVLVKGQDLFRVRVGPLDDVTDADRMLEAVTRAGYPNARIIVD